MERTKIINEIIVKKGYKSYLEIGLGDGANFRNVVCDHKEGVDPTPPKGIAGIITQGTSDAFFELVSDVYDLIFIDGLHLSEQVEKDIINSWKSLKPGGTILIHDCFPWSAEIATRERNTVAWTGDVYKCVVGLIETYGEKITMSFIPERAGIFRLQKGKTRLLIKPGFTKEIEYKEFNEVWKPVLKAMI
jgi:hypothetical protein